MVTVFREVTICAHICTAGQSRTCVSLVFDGSQCDLGLPVS